MGGIFDDKVILITGGTGSLGQALVKELLNHNPHAIRVFSRNEYLQWEMQRNLNNKIIRYQIGDIRDRDRLSRAMTGVDYVVHAAALKHVPVCEYNPIEAVKTNVVGTINVIEAAIDNRVKKVLAISSDKAVHPINIYGATKLAMEKLITHANVYGNTQFSCIRFGNFKGSHGSVLQLWEKQAEEGRVTVTEKEMTRFWISLEDAAEFTLSCFDKMQGGEIFIPRMPERAMGELLDNLPKGMAIEVTGKREGEKLHELLIAEGEETCLTETEDCFIIKQGGI